MEEHFAFKNFIPSYLLMKSADEKLSKAVNLAPVGARTAATVRMIGNSFLSQIDIQSAQGHFMSEAIGIVLADVVDRSVAKLADTLSHWRTEGGGKWETSNAQNGC